MKNNLLITIIIAVVFGAVGFYAGMKYQQSQRARMFGAGQRQSRTGFRPVNGEIIGVDDKSITVKAQDGSSKIVFISDTTAITRSAEGSVADLKEGQTVGVFGIENADGSITAQSIQLNPMFRNIERQ